MELTNQQINNLRDIVWEYYRAHGRKMPWRNSTNPYYVLVSELMLQQTQVSRVIPKFAQFIAKFPDVHSVASASLADVLAIWSGLGYNRRAKFLHAAAQKIVTDFQGTIPSTLSELVSLPGIGSNTAGSILAYSANQPVVFIETNIRTVLLHHFFADQQNVDDKVLREIAQQVLDHENPREWYWALMDYGTHLKQTSGGRLDQSKHYKKQSPLSGSLREMRGRIIRQLVVQPLADAALRIAVHADERFDRALNDLMREGMVTQQNNYWCLTGDSDT